ncbi:MAG: CIA30 family protein [Planctomycetota bacterium]|nr:CIA30 family protein [Planctomycetota bacterium]
MKFTLVIASALSICSAALAQPLSIDFDAGVSGWGTVLDGVMGGRSTGRVTQPEAGILRFSGELSLENNGGFSRTQTTVPESSFQGATGIEARVRGDGRTYQFDVRCSDVRMMAGSFQVKFDTVAGEWVTLRLPFEDFKLYSFGRLVGNAPKLTPARVESVGVTLADKKPGAFQIDIDFVRAIGPKGESAAAGSDLASVAKSAGLTTLLSLVEASGLQLPADGRVTIFAPTNKAFEAIPADKVKYLTSPEGRATLQAILKHHILPGALDSGALLQRRGVVALSGQNLLIDGEGLTVAGASLLKTDVAFDRGIVYVIDRVMMPETRSVSEIVSEDPRLSTLLKAVTAAGLARQLSNENEGPWTLLAPSNEAFAALGEETIKALIAEPTQLASVLSAHVIPSRIRRSDMIAQRSARTLLGRDAVSFSLVDGRVTVAGAGIIAGDIEASNGVIHIIDRVLVPNPSANTDAPMAGRAAKAQDVSGIVELAIERGVPLFNDGKPDACAAIYEVTLSAILDLAADAVGNDSVERLRLALAEGQSEKNVSERAWIYRRAMDRVLQDAHRSIPR